MVAGVLLLVWVARLLRRRPDPAKVASAIERMSRVASSPAIAIVGAGAALANPGAFIPLALKDISQTNPNAAQYIAQWLAFTLIALLPLGTALVMLVVVPRPTGRALTAARTWLELHARQVGAVIIIVLAAALLRDGIVGLTG